MTQASRNHGGFVWVRHSEPNRMNSQGRNGYHKSTKKEKQWVGDSQYKYKQLKESGIWTPGGIFCRGGWKHANEGSELQGHIHTLKNCINNYQYWHSITTKQYRTFFLGSCTIDECVTVLKIFTDSTVTTNLVVSQHAFNSGIFRWFQNIFLELKVMAKL